MVRMTGSGRVSKRNRRHLQKIVAQALSTVNPPTKVHGMNDDMLGDQAKHMTEADTLPMNSKEIQPNQEIKDDICEPNVEVDCPQQNITDVEVDCPQQNLTENEPRRSKRIRKPPKRFYEEFMSH